MSCRSGLGLALTALAAVACKSGPDLPDTGGSYSEVSARTLLAHRNGPEVRLTKSGPARFVHPLFAGFDVERAMRTVEFMDARIRTPASPGFVEVQGEFERALREAGYGSSEGLELEFLESAMEEPAWWPLSARVALVFPDGETRVLHEFEHPDDHDRCMLPRYASSASIRGPVAFELDALEPGSILVTETRIRPDLVNRAQSRGAIGIVSASLGSYNVDPSGRDRELDAIQYRELAGGVALPVAQISPRSFALVKEEMLRNGSVTLALDAEVARGSDRVRTLVATVRGTGGSNEVVVIASHLQEPGACDNASGAAGTLECAVDLAREIADGTLSRPERSLVFLFGMELVGSRAWLESTEQHAVAMVAPVMAGESREETGAMPLLERYPDPGALEALPPDQHSSWGAETIDPEWLERPNGLAVVARCAMADVSVASGGWETSENPYEGGTDHEAFVRRGLPAVLFWHFTDWSFNTSLDRIELVDGQEMRRTCVAAVATALAVAAPEPGDLDRYLESNQDELDLRRSSARDAGREDVVKQWETWCTEVRHWFRWLCLGAEPRPPVPVETWADAG